MNRKIIILSLLISFTFVGLAQQYTTNNLYKINKYSLNPAFAGYNGNTECYIGYRQSWVGFEGAPKSEMVDFNGALNEKMGAGVSFISEQTGNFRHFYGSATYAYHIKMSDMAVSIGMNPFFYRNQLDLSQVQSFGSQLDPMLENKDGLAGNTFDIGLGAMFSIQTFNIGLYMPRTIGMKLKYKDSDISYSTQRQFNVHVSYSFVSGPLTIDPIVIVRKTPNSTINYEVGSLIRYNQRLFAGITYKAGNALGICVGGALTDGIVLNYNYELGFGGISSFSSGTHELSIGFLIKRAENRIEPTIFPIPAEEEDKGINEELEARLTKNENDLKTEVKKREDEIARLENMIKALSNQQAVSDAIKEWKGTPFIMNNITFGNGSAKLFSSSFPELNKMVKKMQDDPELKIRIIGYTDNMGSPRYNQKLSEDRAVAIKTYLESKGIESTRITTEGKGVENPIASNDTPEGRAQNRRIEATWNKPDDEVR